MECLLQYLDEIDDLIGACGLIYERLRRLFLALATLAIGLASIASGVFLALVYPPIGLATCLLLFIALLYRNATSPQRDQPQSI